MIASTNFASTAPASQSRRAPPQLGQADFLRLMTTQLTAQDPFKPVDNTQMIAQMAQFSQVAGIGEMNASLRTLVERSGSSGTPKDFSGWIGRSVLTDDAPLFADASGISRGEVAFAPDASNRRWALVDAAGEVVAEGEAPAGTTSVPITLEHAGPLTLVAPGAVRRSAWLTVTAVQDPAGLPKLATLAGAIDPARVQRLG